MTYTITNHQTGRSFEVDAMFEVPFETVWLSVKSLFMPGTTVTITSHNGTSQTFTCS